MTAKVEPPLAAKDNGSPPRPKTLNPEAEIKISGYVKPEAVEKSVDDFIDLLKKTVWLVDPDDSLGNEDG